MLEEVRERLTSLLKRYAYNVYAVCDVAKRDKRLKKVEKTELFNELTRLKEECREIGTVPVNRARFIQRSLILAYHYVPYTVVHGRKASIGIENELPNLFAASNVLSSKQMNTKLAESVFDKFKIRRTPKFVTYKMALRYWQLKTLIQKLWETTKSE